MKNKICDYVSDPIDYMQMWRRQQQHQEPSISPWAYYNRLSYEPPYKIKKKRVNSATKLKTVYPLKSFYVSCTAKIVPLELKLTLEAKNSSMSRCRSETSSSEKKIHPPRQRLKTLMTKNLKSQMYIKSKLTLDGSYQPTNMLFYESRTQGVHQRLKNIRLLRDVNYRHEVMYRLVVKD